MVGPYSGTVSAGGGSGRGALLPVPKSGRASQRHTNGKDHDGPAVTVFIGSMSKHSYLCQSYTFLNESDTFNFIQLFIDGNINPNLKNADSRLHFQFFFIT